MKIALIGYGKMGKAIDTLATERGHEIVLRAGSGGIDREKLKKADVAIEFTRPEAAVGNIDQCAELRVPCVVGTTGWNHALPEVRKTVEKTSSALLYASNFSIGVNIFFELNRKLAEMMNGFPQYDVDMEEIHHIHKLDAPSGTAISLAEDILAKVDRKSEWKKEKAGKDNEIPIRSVREGEVPGTHRVNYRSDIDEIEITHRAHSRKGFALGAVLAAEWLKGKSGVFSIRDMLQL